MSESLILLIHMFEVIPSPVVTVLGVVGFVLAVRKLAYQLYLRFPNAIRVYEFQWKREPQFYWVNRADFSAGEILRLYTLWIMARFDKCLPIVYAERQAAKAQYFHDCGRYSGMRGWHYRYIDSKAWPILLFRCFLTSLFALLSVPSNQKLADFQPSSSYNNAEEK